MKTIKKFFLSFFAIALVSILLSSCFSATTTSIEIKQMPSTTFEVGTTEVEKLMIVKVTDNGVTNEVVLSIRDGQVVSSIESFNLVLEGFDLTTPGSRTAAVKYGELVSYFDYQVLAETNLFAGGDGSSKNPYQITTAEQFMNVRSLSSTKGVYFKLMNDIDMSSVLENGVLVERWAYTLINKSFQGVLDGNGKKLYNVNVDSQIANLDGLFIFKEINNAVIKDLELYILGKDCPVIISLYTKGTTSYTNVDIYGKVGVYSGGSNTALYTIYASNATINFIDCDSYVDILGPTTPYLGVFIGQCPSGRTGHFNYVNSFNHGFIEARKIGVYISNTGTSSKVYITESNSGNKGTLSCIEEKSNVYVGAYNASNTYVNGVQGVPADGGDIIKGEVVKLADFNFATNSSLEGNKLAIAKGENITDVKVSLVFFVGGETGTNTAGVDYQYSFESNTSVTTDLYFASLVDGKLSINVIMASEYAKADGETEIKFSEWLVYNVEQQTYVYDGTKVSVTGIYDRISSITLIIVNYNGEDAVSGSTIKVTK